VPWVVLPPGFWCSTLGARKAVRASNVLDAFEHACSHLTRDMITIHLNASFGLEIYEMERGPGLRAQLRCV
jgi:hypothetical protein